MKTVMRILTIPALLMVLAAFAASCASNSAESRVKEQNILRRYERYKSSHTPDSRDDMQYPGIYFYGSSFYVVLALTDSGTDRFPEWGCEKLLVSFYGYGIANQADVSDEEFYSLAEKFYLEDLIEDSYQNIALIRVRERDVFRFLETYRSDQTES